METKTKGQAQLAALLTTGGGTLSCRAVASAIGTDPTLVSRWAAGTRSPGQPFRLALQRAYAIEPDDWLTSEDREIAEGRRPKLRTAEG